MAISNRINFVETGCVFLIFRSHLSDHSLFPAKTAWFFTTCLVPEASWYFHRSLRYKYSAHHRLKVQLLFLATQLNKYFRLLNNLQCRPASLLLRPSNDTNPYDKLFHKHWF